MNNLVSHKNFSLVVGVTAGLITLSTLRYLYKKVSSAIKESEDNKHRFCATNTLCKRAIEDIVPRIYSAPHRRHNTNILPLLRGPIVPCRNLDVCELTAKYQATLPSRVVNGPLRTPLRRPFRRHIPRRF